MGDEVRAFEVPALGMRGAIVRLRDAWRELASRGARDADVDATNALAEAIACCALLDGTLGLRASLSVQVRNAAPVALLFAECTTAGALRGIVRTGGERGGSAVLALTVEDAAGLRQQAHVPFEPAGVAASLAAHFERSDRLPTRWRIVHDAGRVSAILLQETTTESMADRQHALAALDALSPDLLHQAATEDLLPLVFPEVDLRLFEARALQFGCSCSRERVLAALRGIDPAELEDERTAPLEVACECCGARYEIGLAELAAGADGRSRSSS